MTREKVYIALSHDYALRKSKILSVHKTFDGAYDAIETMANYDANNGYGFLIHKDKEHGVVTVDHLDEDDENNECYAIKSAVYAVKEKILFT